MSIDKPISSLGENYLLNLYHGPTLAFKDYAMCLLAKIYEYYLNKNDQKLLIIGATSGDTGSAAIHAFKGIENIKIFILHPHNSTSHFQRKQMTTSGANNVYNLALAGTFDDCQSLVKQAFKDESLNESYNLTAVNSINWFRVLPQSIYYAWCYLNHSIDNFVVPSGNFGNIYSAYLLKKMGSKIRFVTPDYFKPKDLDSFDVEYFDNLELGIESADIVMMLRIQKERINDVNLPSIDEYFKHFGLTYKKLTNAKKDVLVMHPGPINRNIEIESSLADDLDKSVINEQVENGVAVRMACLAVMVK